MFQTSIQSIGRNWAQAKRFCAGVNLPKSVKCQNRHGVGGCAIRDATKRLGEGTMVRAANRIRQLLGGEIAVSCDGTCQRQGFQSRSGVCTVLSVSVVSGLLAKVLDVEVLSNFCQGCVSLAKGVRVKSGEYRTTERGVQKILGVQQGMEPWGVKGIFRRSMEKFSLVYAKYLGDRDSKSSKTVTEAGIYPGVEIEKLECVGIFRTDWVRY